MTDVIRPGKTFASLLKLNLIVAAGSAALFFLAYELVAFIRYFATSSGLIDPASSQFIVALLIVNIGVSVVKIIHWLVDDFDIPAFGYITTIIRYYSPLIAGSYSGLSWGALILLAFLSAWPTVLAIQYQRMRRQQMPKSRRSGG